MILGYSIIGPDNDYNMFGDLTLGECEKYSDVEKLNIIDPRLQFKNIKYPLSGSTSYVTDGSGEVYQHMEYFLIL